MHADRVFSSLRHHRNYRLFFYGQLVSLAGTWMQDAALPWLVLQETHSALDVGLLIFCRFIPYLILGLYAGVLADRFDNRRLLIATQVVSLGIAALLAALALSSWTPLWAILLLAVLGGTASTFEGPNRHSLVFQLVGRDDLPNAVSLYGSLFNGARAVGPAVAGVLIATVGVGWCFAVNALSFLAILVTLLLMRPAEFFPIEEKQKTPTWRAITESFSYVRRSPPVAVVLGLTLVISTIGFNFRVLVPVFAEKTLHASAGVFGVLFACFGVGALLGALVVAALGRSSWSALIGGSLAFNGAVLAMAPVRSTFVAALLLVLSGAGFAAWMAMEQSVIQLTTPDHLRGRVLSLYLLVLGGLQPIGGLLGGWLADVGGTALAYSVAGVVGVAATLVAAARARGFAPGLPSIQATLVEDGV